MKCDFCSSTPVAFEYPARDIELHAGVIGAPPDLDKAFVSVGSWYACAECHGYIDAQDWRGLETRQVTTYLAQHPADPGDQTWLRAWVRVAQVKFRAARRGLPRPVPEEER